MTDTELITAIHTAVKEKTTIAVREETKKLGDSLRKELGENLRKELKETNKRLDSIEEKQDKMNKSK